jgi:hypothetical protein
MGMGFATRTAKAEFGARAARLNNRNTNPEGRNFLRDGFNDVCSSRWTCRKSTFGRRSMLRIKAPVPSGSAEFVETRRR